MCGKVRLSRALLGGMKHASVSAECRIGVLGFVWFSDSSSEIENTYQSQREKALYMPQ